LKKAAFYFTGLLFVLATGVGAGDVQVRYKVTDLGALTYAFSINSSGQVGGNIVNNYPAVWNDGSVTQMQPLSQRGYAYDLNNSGMVVGVSNSKAVTWDLAGNVTYLPLQLGTLSSVASDVNDYGVVAGHILNSQHLLHACYWSKGGFTDLGVPFGQQSTVRALNNAGDIVVDSWQESGIYHTYIYRNGQYTPINNDLASIRNSYATHMNEGGMVVGALVMPDLTQTAYLWQNGVRTLLPTPHGKNCPSAQAVNSTGIVVGSAWNTGPFSGGLACIWDERGVTYLNDLIPADSGWILEYANDINDSGQIVGAGTLGGVSRGFLLTPVPEPSSVISLIFGMVNIGLLVRRRQR
jgi:uncharacterized membrane protein